MQTKNRKLKQLGIKLVPLQSELPLRELPQPRRVYLSCDQHIGPAAEVVVRIGQQLDCGEVVARRADGLSIHTSIAGTVIEKISLQLAHGRHGQAVVVERDDDQLHQPRLLPGFDGDWRQLEPQQMLERIFAAGVVGMGGATFPSAIKASAALNRSCDYLILNGSECEPQMNCDRMLMLHDSERIIDGLVQLQRLSGARQLIVALLEQQVDARQRLLQAAATRQIDLAVKMLPNRYTMGSEKVLIHACTGREVPVRKLPIDVSTLLFNVGTCAAVGDAVVRRLPVISRIITVAGLGQSHALRVRLGTRLDFILEQLQIETDKLSGLIVGGPMMGKAFHNFQLPVTKGCTGVYLQQRRPSRPPERPCIRCGACLPACPVNLQPSLLFQLLEQGHDREAEGKGLLSCIDCGACSAVCPSHIPLAHTFRSGKLKLQQPSAVSE